MVVSGDAFRHSIHRHSYIGEAEGFVFATMDVAIRALLDSGHDVIVDETCTTEQTLLRYLRIDPDAVPVFIDTSMAECMRRAVRDGRAFLEGPIRRMNDQLASLLMDWDVTLKRVREHAVFRNANDNFTCSGNY